MPKYHVACLYLKELYKLYPILHPHEIQVHLYVYHCCSTLKMVKPIRTADFEHMIILLVASIQSPHGAFPMYIPDLCETRPEATADAQWEQLMEATRSMNSMKESKERQEKRDQRDKKTW